MEWTPHATPEAPVDLLIVLASRQLGQEGPVVSRYHSILHQVPAARKRTENEPSPQSCKETSPSHNFKGKAEKPGHSNNMHSGSFSSYLGSSACVNNIGSCTQLSKQDAAQSSLSIRTSKGLGDLHTQSKSLVQWNDAARCSGI